MTSTASPRPPLADEAALRQAFDAEYPGLLDSARQQLGEAQSLAPRVVETAFAHAWLDRDHLHTAAELHAMLADEVQRGSARALSRRASAHRFGDLAHGHAAATGSHAPPVVTPEDSWHRLVHTIHVEGHSAEAHRAAADVVRHEAAEHVKEIAKGGNWKVPAAIAAVAVLITLGVFFWLDNKGRDKALERAVNAQDTREVAANAGQLADVTLDDGTRARVAADTRIKIPKEFSDELRGVRLEGAASFDVAPGKKTEFQLFARNAVVVAKGTTFDVRAYPQDDAVTVHVREGRVTVRVGEQLRDVDAGKGLVVTADGAMREPAAVELEEATAWLENKLVVAGRPLRAALPQFKRWYNVDIKVIDPKLLERSVTVRSTTEATNDAIAQVERTGSLKFDWMGQNMVFRDAAAAPAPVQAGKKASGKG